MKQHHRALTALLLTSALAAATPAIAQDNASYGSQIGDKAARGLANITTSMLEIPRGVVNGINESYGNEWSNPAFGAAGGTIMGILNMSGRTMVGLADLLTFPFPTEPMIDPIYVWDDWGAKTTYGKLLQKPKSKSRRQ